MQFNARRDALAGIPRSVKIISHMRVEVYMEKTIKVFQLNDYEWWAGESLESVVEYYENNVTNDPDEMEELKDAYELSDEALDTLIFNDEDGSQKTFRQELENCIKEKQEFPCFFATSES